MLKWIARLLDGTSAVAGIGSIAALTVWWSGIRTDPICFTYEQIGVFGLIMWALLQSQKTVSQRRYYNGGNTTDRFGP